SVRTGARQARRGDYHGVSMRSRVACSVFVLFLMAGAGCGGSSSIPFECSGSVCTCPPTATCDITSDTCGGGACSLPRVTRTACAHVQGVGGGGEIAGLSCDQRSSCVATLGAGATATCSGGSICQVTCAHACTLDCSGDASCSLTCTSPNDGGVNDGGPLLVT